MKGTVTTGLPRMGAMRRSSPSHGNETELAVACRNNGQCGIAYFWQLWRHSSDEHL